MSGPTPYFHQRAMAGAGPTPPTGLRTPSPAIRSMVPDMGICIGTRPFGSSFHMEPTPRPVMIPHGDGSTDGGSRESEKKKRGRPRKYGPDGSGGSGSSPQPRAVTPGSGSGSGSGSGWSLTDPSQKRGRGRPPGSGKIQRLALLGEWAVSTAGRGFTPHVLKILEGEDIAAKIASFSQQATRAVCVMSASGAISRLTLSQPSSSRGNVTYEGRFQIIYMSGSYMTTEDGGTRTRTGDLSIAVSSPEGHVFGGPVGGALVAATNVQVIIGSFVYLGPKAKNKDEESLEGEAGAETEYASANRPNTPVSNQNANSAPVVVGWPGPTQMENRPGRIDIDLARG
ncbi:AT hook motif DNA-binding family protein [Rhynchospora pubera]|uniref:AT-hook motif nuclear-localized protein n=1 Tax=Rhynchospora pubera TaxID=906938 RepID=A0AAV8GHX6_9POAL|nr:AT hook motif DNA-binding family protein [Rhynchospora pubera]